MTNLTPKASEAFMIQYLWRNSYAIPNPSVFSSLNVRLLSLRDTCSVVFCCMAKRLG